MSSKTARTHTQTSNRAKPRDNSERKTIFKAVLDNPYKIKWPTIPVNIQNSCLAGLITTLDGVSDYHTSRDAANRKRKKAIHLANPKRHKRRKLGHEDEQQHTADAPPLAAPDTEMLVEMEQVDIPEPPHIISHLSVGINQVTKRLEAQLKSSTTHVVVQSSVVASVTSPLPPPITMVFVCRADIDPPILIDHLPHLVAAFNSRVRPDANPPRSMIKLITLPKGAEASLAQALNIRRVAVVALDAGADLSIFSPWLESIPTVTAPWLESSVAASAGKSLIPTHVKQLRTSAPKDMKGAKEKRAQGRAAAKEKRKGHGVS